MQNRNFEVRTLGTPDSGKKVDGGYFEEWLNQNFVLSRYGRGLEEIFLLYDISRQPGKNHFQYHPDDQFLELSLALPEEKIRKAGPEASLLMMATAFLNTLAEIPPMVIEGFELSRFRKEVAELIQ